MSNTIATYLSETKLTLRLALPLILTQLLQMSVATVDSIMAGFDSELTLAAVAQGGILWQACILVMIGVCMALSPMIAQAHSAENSKKVRATFQQGIWLSVIMGVIGTLITYYSPHLMHVVQVVPEIISPATNYLHILAFSMPFSALYLVPRFFNEGTGNTKILLYITAASVPINVIGNYILLNGLFGLPKMGASGIAISSTISVIATCIMMWIYITKNHKFKHYQLFKNFPQPNYHQLKEMFKLGIPISITLLMEVGMFVGVTLLSGRLGITVAASNQIALNYASITFMIPLGVSMALTARVGMAVGRNNLAQARIISISGMAIGALTMLGSVIIISLLSKQIAQLYTDEAQVIGMAVSLLALAAIFQIPDGIQVCAAGCLRGLKDTKWSMAFAILGYWVVGMPLAWYMGIHLNKGGEGLWNALIFGLSITAMLGATRLLKLTKTPV